MTRRSRHPQRMLPPLLILAGLLGATGAPAQEESSWIAPLASRSLLLDVQALGDRVVAVGDRGHVLVSEDAGASWTQVPVPTRAMLTALHQGPGDRIWAAGHDAVVISSSDGGRSWTIQHHDPELRAPLFDIWFADEKVGMAVGAYGLFLETADGGSTWEPRTVDEDEPHFYGLTPGPGDTLYIAGEFGGIYRSPDRGQTWDRLESPYGGTFFGVQALRGGSVIVHGLRGNLFRSDNGGEFWEEVETGTTAGLLRAVEREDGIVHVTGTSGAFLVSFDSGRTFRAVDLGDRRIVCGVARTGGETLVLVGDRGIDRLSAFSFEPLDRESASVSP